VALLLCLAACPSRAPEGAARTLGDAAPSSVTSIALEARVPDRAPPPAPDGAAAAGAQAARLDPARCPPATVLVDGAPMKIVSARARRFRVPEGAYTIALSTVSIPCSEYLAEARATKNDEVTIQIGFGPDAHAQRFVFYENDTQLGVPTSLIVSPEKAGDPVEICVHTRVRSASALPGRARHTIEIEGRVRATYCGER
jgi:hypothetical protein